MFSLPASKEFVPVLISLFNNTLKYFSKYVQITHGAISSDCRKLSSVTYFLNSIFLIQQETPTLVLPNISLFLLSEYIFPFENRRQVLKYFDTCSLKSLSCADWCELKIRCTVFHDFLMHLTCHMRQVFYFHLSLVDSCSFSEAAVEFLETSFSKHQGLSHSERNHKVSGMIKAFFPFLW